MNFEDVIRKRFACRKFSSREVEKEKLDKILEAGRISPTAKNLQPELIYVVSSSEGLEKILDVLKNNGVSATFFCTANFANGAPKLIKRIFEEGHEVACHGVDHFEPKPNDAS